MLKNVTEKVIFSSANHVDNGDLKQQIEEVLKTDTKSNIVAMGSFIKTLEDEFEREKKAAE
jgi:hypothetical protein